VRIPIIPGYTDDVENIKATALFVRELGDFKIELLPYHKLGIYRYDALSRAYILRDLNPPSHNYIQMLKEVIEHYGLKRLQLDNMRLQGFILQRLSIYKRLFYDFTFETS
jgi:pyruvate-formate lyase-activating enzyme